MGWRTNLVLFLIAVGLSAYIVFFELPGTAPWEPKGKVFPKLEPR